MKVLKEYPGSHHYWEEYKKTDLFCTHCGKKEVWEETGIGDYYLGPESFCTACNSTANYSGGASVTNRPEDVSVIEQLRTGVTAQPTTRSGK